MFKFTKNSRLIKVVGITSALALALSSTACIRVSDPEPDPEPSVSVSTAPTVEPTREVPRTQDPTEDPTEDPTSEPTRTRTSDSTPVNSCSTESPIEGDTNEERYIDAMRHCTIFDSASEAELMELGTSICSAFDQGATFDDVAEVLVTDGGFPEYETGWTIAASVIFLCPEHEDKLPTSGSGSGMS